MEYVQNLIRCIRRYESEVPAIILQRDYMGAALEIGTTLFGIRDELTIHVAEMHPRLHVYLIGLGARLMTLETACLDGNDQKISTELDRVNERLHLVKLILSSLEKTECPNTSKGHKI
ncbi:MAG TPA: hypothetical protein VJH20_03605 [Candidatus Nanoarchaeia archaeon]|nr:hypothetical protein [Candidatus Nanoarchaeia archaeon]